MYTAAVLRQESTKDLLLAMRSKTNLEEEGFECVTPQGEPLPHHMTINLGKFDSILNDPQILGQPCLQFIDALWFSKEIGACAARVTRAYCDGKEINSINENKHVTICLKPPAKPFHSNKIFENGECIKLDMDLSLLSDIQEVQ